MKPRKKKMQIEDLAELIKKGFDELDTRAETRAEMLQDKIGSSSGDTAHDIAHILEWLEELEARVVALENERGTSGGN